MIAAETAIRARRKLTNRLIAAHDAPRLRPFFDPAAHVIAGNGALIDGADAILDTFAVHFAEAAFIAYTRNTAEVRVDSAGDRAAESGDWVGTWIGRAPMSGTYLAAWKKVTGQWVIESELYVTLSGAD